MTQNDTLQTYATVAYAQALDQVEECLRTGKEPFISNQNLAQIRMYRTSSIQHSSEKIGIPSKTWIILSCFILFAIGGAVEAQGNIVLVPFALIAFVVLAVWVYGQTMNGMISRICGGSKIQQKESAKILNALIKKSL